MTDDARGLAVQFYNQTWDLIGQTGRTFLALEFATAAVERAAQADVPLWLKASTCEGLARAHAGAGHDAERAAWVLKASELLQQVDDPDDRSVVEGQLAKVDRK